MDVHIWCVERGRGKGRGVRDAMQASCRSGREAAAQGQGGGGAPRSPPSPHALADGGRLQWKRGQWTVDSGQLLIKGGRPTCNSNMAARWTGPLTSKSLMLPLLA